jgi:hypothetical protein
VHHKREAVPINQKTFHVVKLVSRAQNLPAGLIIAVKLIEIDRAAIASVSIVCL